MTTPYPRLQRCQRSSQRRNETERGALAGRTTRTQDPDTDPGSRAYTTHLTLSVRPSDSVPKLTWGVLTEQAMWRFLRGGSGTDFAKVVWEQVRSVVVVMFF